MRTIKFRAKRPDDGKWVFGDLKHHQKVTRTGLEPTILVDNDPVVLETIGQFTGLLDKNGKEIYEGDVIRVSAYINKGQGETYDFRDLFTVEDLKGFHRYDFISDIKFNEGGFYLSEYSECDTSLCVLFGDMRHSFPIFECEVLGNIHDNPELLKGGKE